MIRSRYRNVRRGMPGNEDKIMNEKKARGRQSKISWQTKVGLASVLIGTSLALPVQTVKADAAESGTPAAVQKDGKAEQQNETVDQQDKQNASEDKQDQTGDDQQDKQDASEEKQDQTDNDQQDPEANNASEGEGESTVGDTDGDDSNKEKPAADADKVEDTGYGNVYGEPDENKIKKVIEVYNKANGEVLERHTFYINKEVDEDYVGFDYDDPTYQKLEGFIANGNYAKTLKAEYGVNDVDLDGLSDATDDQPIRISVDLST